MNITLSKLCPPAITSQVCQKKLLEKPSMYKFIHLLCVTQTPSGHIPGTPCQELSYLTKKTSSEKVVKLFNRVELKESGKKY